MTVLSMRCSADGAEHHQPGVDADADAHRHVAGAGASLVVDDQATQHVDAGAHAIVGAAGEKAMIPSPMYLSMMPRLRATHQLHMVRQGIDEAGSSPRENGFGQGW